MNNQKEFEQTLPGKVSGAGVLCTNTEGKVLIVVPTYKPEWEIPGGTVESNESPKQACIREVREELGIEIPIGQLLRLNYCLLYTSPSPRDGLLSRMPSSA